MCPIYVAGLIGAGDRKSMQPMAAQGAAVGYGQLHRSSVRDAAPLEKALLAEADRMVGRSNAWLIVDDAALPKRGVHSVGVVPQYASSRGKTAYYQSLVSLTLASREAPVMVGLRLFLPESWTSDFHNMAQARVPNDRQVVLSKLEIAISSGALRLRPCGCRLYMWAAQRDIVREIEAFDENTREDIRESLRKDVYVIWYEAPDDVSAVDLFSRLNSGRIPLDDSELCRRP